MLHCLRGPFLNHFIFRLNARESLKREVQRPTSSGSITGPLTNVRQDDTIPLEFKSVSVMVNLLSPAWFLSRCWLITMQESGLSTENDRRWSRTWLCYAPFPVLFLVDAFCDIVLSYPHALFSQTLIISTSFAFSSSIILGNSIFYKWLQRIRPSGVCNRLVFGVSLAYS